jgi:hypothetical protein
MKNSRTLFVATALLLGVSASSWPQAAWAYTNEEVRAQIEEVLMERHPSDTPDWWRSLGANAPGVIISMYEKTSYTYKRIRLLQGLGWFEAPEAVEFLKSQADTTEESVIRGVAIRAIGFSQGKKETDFISKFLGNRDPQTRFAAADTLQKLNDPHAGEILDKYLKQEKTPWIAPKLRGELPRPASPLTAVATSEDRLAPEFVGEWSGFWLAPKSAREKGMDSLPVAFQLKVDKQKEEIGRSSPAAGIVAFSGELLLQEQKKKRTPRVFRFDRLTGKSTHLSGVLVAVPPEVKVTAGATSPSPSPAPPEELLFEADVSHQAGSVLLELRIRKLGVVLVARRGS